MQSRLRWPSTRSGAGAMPHSLPFPSRLRDARRPMVCALLLLVSTVAFAQTGGGTGGTGGSAGAGSGTAGAGAGSGAASGIGGAGTASGGGAGTSVPSGTGPTPAPTPGQSFTLPSNTRTPGTTDGAATGLPSGVRPPPLPATPPSTGLSSGVQPGGAAGASGRPSTTGRGNTGSSTLPGCPPGSAASGTPRIINDPALGTGETAPGC
jgi:hypothetical protein